MFQNREEAGELLVEKLKKYKKNKDTIVLAIPRGGVVVGKEISDKLNLPLSVVVVKKLGAPFNPELAIGAVASNGVKVLDQEMIARLGVGKEYLEKEIKDKREEIEEREERLEITKLRNYEIRGKTVILTDDGIATGATALVAIKYIKSSKFKVPASPGQGGQNAKLVLAVPVIARDTYDRLRKEVDEIVALEIPEYFGAVGQFYRDFEQVDDEEVIELLASRNQRSASS